MQLAFTSCLLNEKSDVYHLNSIVNVNYVTKIHIIFFS
jgi:hypothetical protein